MTIAKECLHKGNQLFLFPQLKKQGKPAKTDMKYTVHIYYSEHRTTDLEHFEMANNYSYGKGMPAQRKSTPPVPPSKKAR